MGDGGSEARMPTVYQTPAERIRGPYDNCAENEAKKRASSNLSFRFFSTRLFRFFVECCQELLVRSIWPERTSSLKLLHALSDTPIDDGLRFKDNPSLVRLRFEHVTDGDADLISYGPGNDYLYLFLTVTIAMDAQNSSTLHLYLSRPLGPAL